MKFTILAVLLLAFASFTPAHADSAALDKFGFCDGPNRYTDYDAACDEIIASGTKWVRMGAEWGSIEPTSGAYDATTLARLDAVIDKLSSHGVNVLFLLAYTAPWASSQPSLPWPDVTRYKPANWGDWANYVHFVTNRYNNKVKYWEVWNEQDHAGFWKSTPADYETLLQTAATEIRASNPNNKVVLGGLALYNGTVETYGLGSFFDTICGLGAPNYFDIINYHAYGDAKHYYALNGGMQAVINKYSLQSRKMWVTETGYTTVGDATKEANKADMVDQSYLAHTGLNIERVFWYIHRSTNSGNISEDNYGLMDNARNPLKALYFHNAADGAETDFKLAKAYPTQTPAHRTLYFYPATAGDGSYVIDEAADGSTKRIPATRFMYCRLNDNWLYDSNGGLDAKTYVDVTYLNSGTANWAFQYDGASNAYTSLSRTRTNTGAWLTETFTLSDAKFANRQNNAADFRISAGSADLVISKIRVRKEMDKGAIVLGTTDRWRLIEHPIDTNTANEGYNPVATVGGRECRQIIANNKFLYIKVGDGLVRAGQTNVKINIDFYDSGTDNILVQYNAVGNNYKPLYITKTNTNAWRTVTLTVTDANFINAQSYGGDFRISNNFDGGTESIDRVEVTKY